MAKRHTRHKDDYHSNNRHDDKINITAIRGVPHWDPLGDVPTPSENRRDPTRYVKNIKPQSAGQQVLWESIHKHALTVALGPAGTGKTFLAIAAAVQALEAGKVDRIILSRPAVEAGESIGYLPGDIGEKMSPFLRPLMDALVDRMGGKKVKALLAEGVIEIAPVAYMRGRTLNNAFVVIDEVQNCTYTQIKMCLTRLGWHSTMVLTGDPDQTDLLPGISGLSDIADKLARVPSIGVVRLSDTDIVRHPLVASMLGVL
ncbi:MAG: PhoH family protein [Bdellovibrionales bacterium]